MRATSKTLLTLLSLSITLAACSSGDSIVNPDGTVPGVGTNTDGTGTGGTGGTGTGGSNTGGSGGTTTPGTGASGSSGISPDTTYTGGSPGGSTTGGTTETQQGFLGWELQVLPSGELQLRFRQTNLTVSSFAYVVGGSVTGQVQCYNKADNAPNGQPFNYTLAASATLGALSLNGSINAIVITTVLQNACGNTQFTARPVAGQPWTWTNVYLDNPAGRLTLPDISLGDAPVGFSVP